MTLKVEGDPGYGSVSAGSRFTGLDGSETVPLLIPEPEPHLYTWKPLSKEELVKCAGGPGWKKFRFCLVLAFWIGWVVMLGIAITLIVQSPRAVTPVLLWWQKDPFYRLQPALLVDAESDEPNAISRVSERLPYLKSLRVGALILEGLFRKDGSTPNLTQIDQDVGTLPQFTQLMTESRKAGLRIMLCLCEAVLLEPTASNNTKVRFGTSGNIQYSLRYWLEQGVSGFEICDTDTTFSIKMLMEWNVLMREFSSQDDERILMVRQTGGSPLLSNTSNLVNGSLVEMVTKSLIPPSHRPLTAPEVSEAIKTILQMPQGYWPSWTVGGEVPWELQRAIFFLMMTLPGTPIIKYGDELNPVQGQDELRRPHALFRSLSQLRAREEALRFGSFTFLPFNTTMSSTTLNSTATPPLAFLRSWGCVRLLVVFNLGSEPHAVEPDWAPSLPEDGLFVLSTGLDRIGPVSLRTIILQPHEGIVIKLFETDNSS
ncbi:amino acid transporter heavy chain SLC3A2 isoform X1 [Misgurnus anguillicaudatus]|uniref:amino acid transporter heavy chain SLC3A2 isoform X1 n=1 Tax=Misgurnus anguillicaudatus TaxID=75329 RepID=UPI003CCFDFA7